MRWRLSAFEPVQQIMIAELMSIKFGFLHFGVIRSW